MQLSLSINGGHRCEVRFESHHTFQKVINLLKNNNLIPGSVKDDQITILNGQGKKFEKRDYVAASMENAQKNKGRIDITYSSNLLRSGDSNPDPGVRAKLIDIIRKFFDRMEHKKFKDLEQYQSHPEELVKVVAKFAKVYEKEVALQLFWKATAVELAEQEKAELQNYKSRYAQEFEMMEKVRQIQLPKKRNSSEGADYKQLKVEKQLLESSFTQKIVKLEQALARSQQQYMKRSFEQDLKKSRLEESMIIVKQQNGTKLSQLQNKLKGKEEELGKKDKELEKMKLQTDKAKTQMSQLKDILEKQISNWQKERKANEDLMRILKKQLKQREAKMTTLQKNIMQKEQNTQKLHTQIKQMNLEKERYCRQTEEKNKIICNLQINKSKMVDNEMQKDKKLMLLETSVKRQEIQYKQKFKDLDLQIKVLKKQNQTLKQSVQFLNKQNIKMRERTEINPIFKEQNRNYDQNTILNPEELSKTVGVKIELLNFEYILNKKIKNYKTIIRYDQPDKYAADKVNRQLKMCSNFVIICKTQQGYLFGGFVVLEKKGQEKSQRITKASKKGHSSAFLFSFGSDNDKLTMFPLKENQNPLTQDEDFLIFGNEEFCLDYGSAELSRMDAISMQEKYLKYHNSKNFLQESRGWPIKLEWYMIFTCLQ